MFWIIVLVVILIVVIVGVKSAQKNKLEQEHIKDLETRAASGDESAKQELEVAKQKLINKGTNAFSTIYWTDKMPDNIVTLTERKIKEAIAQYGGPDYYDWNQTRNETTKPDKAGIEEWTLKYESPKGDWVLIGFSFYHIALANYFKDARTGISYFGQASKIAFNFTLKMLPENVQVIKKQVEQELIDYLSSNGGTLLKLK